MKYKLKAHFSCAHFYHQPQWDEKKNREEFGLCFTKYGHGHDYALEIAIESSKLEKAKADFDGLVRKLDHQHLNFVIPEFQSKIPTTENLALYCKQNLETLFQPHQTKLLQVVLYETPEIWVEI